MSTPVIPSDFGKEGRHVFDKSGNKQSLFNILTNMQAEIVSLQSAVVSSAPFIPVSLTSVRKLTTGALPTYVEEIAVPLGEVRETSTGSLLNIAGNGGLLATDTTPILNTVNGDTDGQYRISWAATVVDAISFQVTLPNGLDEAANIALKVRAAMSDVNDIPTFAVQSYFNEGDTAVVDATGAVTGVTPATYTATIAAADIPALSKTVSFELTPAAHGTDALYVFAVWLEVTLINSGLASGLLGRDSTPALNTLNGDTDGCFAITWAAGDVSPVGFQVALPGHLDDTANLVVGIRGKMASTNDTPAFELDSYFNEGDTKVEDLTVPDFSDAYGNVAATIAHADVPSGARTLSIELTPEAHATDALIVTSIWVDYSSTV